VEQRAGFSLESQEILEQLEHDNLFLIALDEERTWYRYHHLFGEVLQHRLRRSHADVIPHVHRRASEWFLQQNMMVEAIHHALEATDYERATVLIEQVGIADFALPHMQRSLKRWLELLPAEVVFDRPRLCLINALIFFVQVKISAALQWIEFATSALARARSQFAGEAAHDEIAGEIAALRAMSIAYHPDYRIDDALALSQQTLATLKDTQPTFRCLAAFALALARLKQGDVAAAEQALVEANRNGQAAGNAYLVGTAVSILAATQRAQGDLHRALATCQGTLAWASQRAVAGYPVFGGVHLNLAEVCREQNRLDAALHHVEQAIARGNRANDPSNWIICHLVLLRVHQGLGEWETAHTLLRQLGEWIEQHPSIVDGSLLPAMCAQFQVAEAAGSDDALLHEAWAWAEGAQWEEGELVAASRFFEYVYLYEHRRIARVQVFLAWARVHGDRQLVHEALAYLERQLPIAQAARIHWFQVKIHLLRALALDILDASAEIDLTLHQALRLAQPQGYVRIFVDEGEAMRDLLVKARNQSTEPQLAAYADQLLDAFPFIAPSPSQPTPHLPAFAPGLVEQLTERELEILRLVNDGLSNREIATTLIVSLGTIKKHLNNIFGKLGVHSRTQALVTARKLHLI
jgi:LuxR family maltose regulon positive regulatory protein